MTGGRSLECSIKQIQLKHINYILRQWRRRGGEGAVINFLKMTEGKGKQEETKQTLYPLQKLQTSRQCEDGGGDVLSGKCWMSLSR